ncbi:glycosyltransferase [Vibrio aquaticus]|uniref:Glycosyltransferase n=1 Tax=Vibrio aquaticus TaxID=2496559 RepID=A0A3S0MQ78_9VIBR|nr:WecB/TagA/CpsF family glycosyltransferase [Vibrio aquaticus]RTZ17424.1 glycosyltransferase [Vibrio aquaticus]
MSTTILSKVNYLEDREVEAFIDGLIATNEVISLGFINQHGYNLTVQNGDVYKHFIALDYLLRDGIGIELACKLKGLDAKANLNGTDLIPKIASKALVANRDTSFFVYGTEEPWLSKGSKALFKSHSVQTLDGFHSVKSYQAHFKEHHNTNALNLVVLAMGMPKQEEVASLLKQTSQGPLLVICGGAIIDFQGGKTERAPKVWRKLNLEWLYRLIKEPRRMFQRYVIGIPKFLYYVLIDR